jgi:hypothetical protein
MNSGLPILLDAIFGKKDLSSVSLDEIYELINEFPSFNAAHFLLSKKLKQENGSVYEKENMRTALYFNNAFWLHTLLEERTVVKHSEIYSAVPNNHPPPAIVAPEMSQNTEDELDEEEKEILDERSASETVPSESGFQHTEPVVEQVTSFDELMSKYNIQEIITVDETSIEVTAEKAEKPDVEVIVEIAEEPVFEGISEEAEEQAFEVKVVTADHSIEKSVYDIENEPPIELSQDSADIEIRHEILNEYGIFEELIIEKHDYDSEAFDGPTEMSPPNLESVHIETPQEESKTIAENKATEEPEEEVSGSIVENQIRAEEQREAAERDYEAFDRPIVKETNETETDKHDDSESDYPDPSETSNPDESFIHREDIYVTSTIAADNTEMSFNDAEGQNHLHELSERFGMQQKSAHSFDTKKAESIVFAPYHMVDYFASQGIKLVLEDQPVDSFGKQLKSFTDWLKVMKKIPAQPLSMKSDEKEVDRIRHFAAHSVEERDILTESMAEVLAKQGMYENAIALYQKLSLIYPPKSAYFASRIEQLKASLP